MTGTYKTSDGSIYEVYLQKMTKPARTELMAKCTKSTVREGPQQPFTIKEKNIEQNLRHQLWTKIES